MLHRALRAALAVLAGCSVLSACGFHLAGTRPLPDVLRRVYIDVTVPYRVSETPLETSLRARLTRQGAVVVKQPSDASTTIRLTSLREGRQVLSVGPDGKAIEFLLVTTVDYEVIDGGEVLIPPSSLRVSRDYSFDQDQVLAKESEEDRLREYIQDQMAELILLKVETQLSHRSDAPAAPASNSQDVKPAVVPGETTVEPSSTLPSAPADAPPPSP